MNPFDLEPECKPFPIGAVALQCPASFAMSFEIFWNPCVPTFAIDGWRSMVFLGFKFGSQGFRLGGVVRIVGTETGGTVNFLLVRVQVDDIPKRRSGFAI